MSILDRRLDDTAFAVLDLETTGFRPGVDRIVEICLVRLDPGERPAIALDTLLDPRRAMDGTRVHGVEAADVVGAPTFPEVAGEVLRALSGRVLVGHNVSFDRRFLEAELHPLEVPQLDTIDLRPLLGDGERASLSDACATYGIVRTGAHQASADAWDTARLLQLLLNRARQLGLRSFRELARRGPAEVSRTWATSPLAPEVAERLPVNPHRKSRVRPFSGSDEIRTYHEALMLVLADLVVSEDELGLLAGLRERLGLAIDEVRGLHAQVLAAALLGVSSDRRVSEAEVAWLARVAECLGLLGWCPGR